MFAIAAVDQLNLTAVCKTLHETIAGPTSLSSPCGTDAMVNVWRSPKPHGLTGGAFGWIMVA